MHRTGPTRRWARWWGRHIATFRQRRRARWDRPPEPHDWRWMVALVGRLLVLTGLLMLGFVAYQLWGTGVQTAAAQRDLDSRFTALIAQAAAEPEPEVSTTTSTPSEPAPPETVRVEDDVSTSIDVATTVPTTSPPSWPPSTGIALGDPIARIEMPTLGTDHIVVAGVGVDELQQGPGHFPDTPMPGQLGNAAIAGHRTTYGQPFHDVDQLAPGDDIVLTTPAGRFVYQVTNTRIVAPSDYYVVATTDWDNAMLTLTSCHPKWSAAQRIIVSAALDTSRSDTPSPPTGYVGATSTTESSTPTTESSTPSSTPTTSSATPMNSVASTSPVPTLPADADLPSDSTTTSTTSPPDTTTTTPAAVPLSTGSGVTSDAAFSRGWFHDTGAVAPSIAWGFALIAIAVLAGRLNRRFRTLAAGTLPLLIPFVIVLYLFYAQVNRLLPPNL